MVQSPLAANKTRRAARLKPGATYKTHPLNSKNRQALKLLQVWMSAPDDKGADWWADFERELAQRRPAFRTT